jgi:hypothetical protein
MGRELDAAIHFFLLSVALVVFFRKYHHYALYLKFIGFFLVVTLLFDFAAALIMFYKPLGQKLGNNLFLYHILTPIQYSFIALLYRDQIQNPRYKKIIIASIPLFILFSLAISGTIQGFSDYNSYALLLKYILTILWILVYLRQLVVAEYYTSLQREPLFWISTALLIHAVGNIFVEGLANYLIANFGNYFTKIYYIYSVLNYMLFLFFTIAFLIYKAYK